MAFIGWIKAQAEDVEFHRQEEFHFTMGAQEVNQGMDLGQQMLGMGAARPNSFTGVATMRKGEVAMLDLSPEFAYGAEGCLAVKQTRHHGQDWDISNEIS